MLRINRVLEDIKGSAIHKYDHLKGQRGYVSLTLGESDYQIPDDVYQKCKSPGMLRNGHYMPTKGLQTYREAVSYKLKTYGLDYDPETEIMATSGVQAGIDIAMRTLIGSEKLRDGMIILPDPAYVSYMPNIKLAGGYPIRLKLHDDVIDEKTGEKNDYRVCGWDLFNVVNRYDPKYIILNYPNNPTGAIMTQKDWEDIADILVNNDMFLISDEIYSDIYFDDEKHFSPAKLEGMRDRILVLNGFSKSYAMGGWRIGYAAGPVELIKEMTKLANYTSLCSSRIAQEYATEAVYHGDKHIATIIEDYKERRDYMVLRLNIMGLPTQSPKGAMFAFPDISSTGLTSEQLVETLVNEHKLITVPGSGFGTQGENHLRLSFSVDRTDIIEGLDRLENAVNVIRS